jgi:hypothetical protein
LKRGCDAMRSSWWMRVEGEGMTGLYRTRRPRNPSGRVLAVQQATCRRWMRATTDSRIRTFCPRRRRRWLGFGFNRNSETLYPPQSAFWHDQSGVSWLRKHCVACSWGLVRKKERWESCQTGGRCRQEPRLSGKFLISRLSGKRGTRYRRGPLEGPK